MIKKISAFLLMCMLPSFAFCGVGGHVDNREVVGWIDGKKPSYIDKNTTNAWNTHPYYNIVRVESGGGSGTGEFISARHILTNNHVVEYDAEYKSPGCGYSSWPDCDIQTSDGKNLKARVVFFGGKSLENYTSTQDWVVLEITDKDFCSGRSFGYKTPTFSDRETEINNVWRGGFSGLRKLSDSDINFIKDIYTSMLELKYYDMMSFLPDVDAKFNYIDTLVKQNVDKKVNIGTKDTLKIGGTTDSYRNWFLAMYAYKTTGDDNKILPNGKKALPEGRSFIDDYLNDSNTLKVVKKCRVVKGKRSGLAEHTCDSWNGDSGSSVNNSNNQIILLHNSGEKYITSESANINKGLFSENIFKDNVREALNRANEYCKGKSSWNKTQSVIVNDERVVGRECLSSDLPSGAVSGHYISGGSKKYNCSGGVKCACAATRCGAGYYLYVNTKGYSMGWCHSAKKRCPSGQHLNVIDGYKTDGQCVDDVVELPDVIENPDITGGNNDSDVSVDAVIDFNGIQE